jgi:hypothetical protein
LKHCYMATGGLKVPYKGRTKLKLPGRESNTRPSDYGPNHLDLVVQYLVAAIVLSQNMAATHNCTPSITKFSVIFFVKCKESRVLLPNQRTFLKNFNFFSL